jgi:hypothetical protein
VAPAFASFENLIVASTCYHVILACLIARDTRFPGPSLLAVNARREQMAALCGPLARAADSPFAATMQLPDAAGPRPARERVNARWLAGLDDFIRSKRVFVFNDLKPDVQLLCRRASGRGAQTFCAEDGGAVYSSLSWASPWPLHLRRIVRFGQWIENLTASGSSRYVQVCLALHPDLVRPELQRKPVWALQQSALPDLLASSWIGEFLSHYQMPRAALACDELYALARGRTEEVRKRLRGRLSEEIRASRHAGRDCVVKYHPQEPEDFLGAAALGARLLPTDIPAELVYLASGERLRRVIGDAGTTLLTARWLAPQAEVFSALNLSGRDDPWYARTLDRLGVQRLQ